MSKSKTQTDRSDSEVRLEADVILRRIQELKMNDKEKELLSLCINNFDKKDSAKRIIGFIDGKLDTLEQFIKLEMMIRRLAIQRCCACAAALNKNCSLKI